MKKIYDIYLDQKIIGTAEVIRSGLYYRILCRCDTAGAEPCRISVLCGNAITDLGLCVPLNGAFGLETHIPAKRIGEGELCFRANPRNPERNGKIVKVEQNRPFQHIRRLKDAQLVRQNEELFIRINNQKSSSSPMGQ